MPFTEPALTWDAFSERITTGPEYELSVTRHTNPDQTRTSNNGESDELEAVVLLHGLAASSWTWHDVVDATPRGYESICIDLLGHGESPKPRHKAYSVYDHARHVIHTIEALGITRFSLVGNSLGGGCALLTAAILSQRATIKHIVSLEGIGVWQPTPLPFKLARVPLLPEFFKRFVPAKMSARAALRMCYADPSRITDEQVAAYAAPAQDRDQPYAAINSARYVKPDDIDSLPDRYASVDAPTLLIWGCIGNIVPLSVAKTLQTVLPNTTLEVLPDCGHIPHEERPETVVPMIWKFLQGV